MSEQAIVRVVLADDHAVVRAGLRMVLEHDGQIVVVGEAGTGQEAVELARAATPDVVIMDFAMPDLNGAEACRQILAEAPNCRVLFLSMYEDEAYFIRALEAGAAGYLVKRTAAADLVQAVVGTARGAVYLAPTLASIVLRHRSERSEPVSLLSEREREVLQLVAEGHTSQAIARRLGISLKTVQTHRAHIMEKLDLRDITQLVRFAIRHGIILAEP
jgi:NarL family two-component system response regulator LiaR